MRRVSIYTVVVLALTVVGLPKTMGQEAASTREPKREILPLTVIAAQVLYQGDEPRIAITLNEHSRDDFGAFTKNYWHQHLDVLVDDKVVTTYLIQQPIFAGEIVIFGLSTDESATTAKKLRDGEARLAVRADAPPICETPSCT